MNRMPVLFVAALLAVAPFEAASAQDGPRGGRPQREESRPERQERPTISYSEAQRIAQSRAGNARYVGSRGMSGGAYVFAFERDGRVFNISVDASR
jgi:hypothetical protein